jgi:ADP-ribose pyrophosphatase YjhB (NUDIX family)
VPTPDYVLDLRRAYGQGRLLLPGVSAVVLRDDLDGPGRHVLLNRRSDSGRWSLPSGIVEPDEQPAVALAREVAEETCVEVDVERLALLVTEPEMRFGNGDRCQFISMTFRCRYRSGEAAVGDDESTAVGWFPVERLPPDLDEKYRRRIKVALADQAACVFEV